MRGSKVRLAIGGTVLRIFATLACLLGVVVGLGLAQEREKQTRRRFDPPSVVTAVDAIYPLNSVASGTVVLEVSLDGVGKITDIRVVRGIASLTEPAEDSVRQWTFQPGKLNGKPVSSKIVAAFSFVPPNVGPRV
jgi:Gram-negative bacterial TonB protein C-terminal